MGVSSSSSNTATFELCLTLEPHSYYLNRLSGFICSGRFIPFNIVNSRFCCRLNLLNVSSVLRNAMRFDNEEVQTLEIKQGRAAYFLETTQFFDISGLVECPLYKLPALRFIRIDDII